MKKVKRARPEIFIIALLIACIAFIIHYDQNNGRSGVAAVVDEKGHVSIIHIKKELSLHKSTGRKTLTYQPDACQLVLIYDENLDPYFSLAFTADTSIHTYIDQDEALMNMYRTGKSGSSVVMINGKSHVVNFSWDEVGETKYLIAYINSKDGATNITIFTGVCYLTLILALTLFTTTIYWTTREVTRRYRQIRREVNSRIL